MAGKLNKFIPCKCIERLYEYIIIAECAGGVTHNLPEYFLPSSGRHIPEHAFQLCLKLRIHNTNLTITVEYDKDVQQLMFIVSEFQRLMFYLRP